MPQQLRYHPVIHMHFRQFLSIAVPEYMGTKLQQFTVVIPDIFLAYHLHDLVLDHVILVRFCRIIFLYKNIWQTQAEYYRMLLIIFCGICLNRRPAKNLLCWIPNFLKAVMFIETYEKLV